MGKEGENEKKNEEEGKKKHQRSEEVGRRSQVNETAWSGETEGLEKE